MFEGMVVASCGEGIEGAAIMFEGGGLGWQFRIVGADIAGCMVLHDGIRIVGWAVSGG